MTTRARTSNRRAAIASLVGTTLEWYDFTLFTLYSALLFPTLFFVGADPEVAVVQSLGVFAAGFLARPLGALYFGRMGDRHGRKKVLIATLFLMGAATTLIGVLPTHAAVGAWAPLMLLVLRLAQGFAAGAEVGSAITVAAEYSSASRRGLWASFPAMGNFAGLVLSALAVRLVIQLPEEQLYTWGWRVPFLLGIVVVAVGVAVRLGLDETPAYLASQTVDSPRRTTISDVARTAWKPMLVLGIVYFACNGLSYFYQALAAAYARGVLDITPTSVADATLYGAICGFFTVPAMGALSDKIGRRPVMILGFTAALATAVLLFLVIPNGSAGGYVTVMVLALAVANAAYNSGVNSFGTELFSTEHRLTGMTVSREVAGSIGGGIVPLIGASLMGLDAAPYALVALAAGLAMIGTVTVLAAKETRGASLQQDIEAPITDLLAAMDERPHEPA